MPAAQLSGSILSAGADYRAGNWADLSAGAALDLDLRAELKRGLRLEAGAQVLAGIDASLRRFLALDVSGEAHAAARVQAQVQMPLDLFDEFGLAVRLHAIAEIAASVDLAVGLSTRDFLALADSNPLLQGIGASMLRILLEESVVQGGVKAKIAASAIAHAGLSITGTLIAKSGEAAGFTIAADAGVGLKVGAGFRAYTRFGVAEPRRLVRRAADLTIDSALHELTRSAAPAERGVMQQLRTPAKIAFRSCLEAGFALAEVQAFDTASMAKLAQRCVQVSLEEAQRAIFEALHDRAAAAMQAGLSTSAMPQAAWTALRPQRLAMARAIRQLPSNPFDEDGTGSNAIQWAAVFDAGEAMLAAAIALHAPAAQLTEPLAQLWATTILLRSLVEKVSVASARASMIGLAPVTVAKAFTGPVEQPPTLIGDAIRTALGPGTPAKLTHEHALEFLLRPALTTALLAARPDLAPVIRVFSDTRAADVQVLRRILENANALAVGGATDPAASLGMILGGLRDFVNVTVDREIKPVLQGALAEAPGWLRPYVDEVILPSLDYGVNSVMGLIIDSVRLQRSDPKALREACSCIVFQLLARALVVSADVISNDVLGKISGALGDLRDHADDAGGPVEVLAALSGIDRPVLAELVEDVLDIAAGVFTPLPPDQRVRLRELSYEALDIAPATRGAELLEALADDAFLPNAEASSAMAVELSGVISARIITAIRLMLERIAHLVLEELEALIADLERRARQWLADVAALIDTIAGALQALEREIRQRLADADAALSHCLDTALAMLTALDSRSGRRALRNGIADAVYDQARGVLSGIGVYQALPRPIRRTARAALRGVIDDALDDVVFNAVLASIADIAESTEDLVADMRGIDLDEDISQQLVELLLDRLEAAARDELGGNPRFDIRIPTPLGAIELGRIEFPLHRLIATVRAIVRDLALLQDAAEQMARDMVALIGLEQLAAAAMQELDVAERDHARATRDLAEGRLIAPHIAVISPLPGATLARSAVAELALAGVPRSYLGLESGQMVRVLVWVNQTPIVITASSVVDGTAPAASPGTDLPRSSRMAGEMSLAAAIGSGGRLTSGLGRAGMPRAGGNLRGASEAALRRGDFGAIGRPSLASAIDITGSAPLRLRLALPAEALVAGINTLTVTVLDGDASHRRSVSVSFLVPERGSLRGVRQGSFRLPDPLRDEVSRFGGDVSAVRGDQLRDALVPATDRAPLATGRGLVTVAARTRISHAMALSSGAAMASGAQQRAGLRLRSERSAAVDAAAERLATQDGAVLHDMAQKREATALIHSRCESRARRATALLDVVGRADQRGRHDESAA